MKTFKDANPWLNHGIPFHYENYLCIVTQGAVRDSVSLGLSAVPPWDEPYSQNGIVILIDDAARYALKICFNGDYSVESRGKLTRYIRSQYAPNSRYFAHTESDKNDD